MPRQSRGDNLIKKWLKKQLKVVFIGVPRQEDLFPRVIQESIKIPQSKKQ